MDFIQRVVCAYFLTKDGKEKRYFAKPGIARGVTISNVSWIHGDD